MPPPRWLHQIRVVLEAAAAEAARRGGGHPALEPVRAILARHDAALVCQYDAFVAYCEEAERRGVDADPLYAWTKATIERPEKKARYVRSFSIHVGGEEVYAGDRADALQAALEPLVGGGAVAGIARHDTDPENNPQPPARYRC